MRVLISIDDTDNKESRGTGHLARGFGEHVAAEGWGAPISISRHQLFFDPRVPYTSHNSSLCIYLETESPPEILFNEATTFVAARSAVGSDPGVCVAKEGQVGEAIMDFGRRAKREIMTQGEARAIARENGLLLAGLGGTEDGVIGAVAGVGLRATGRDGRCPWLPGMRELQAGKHSAASLLDNTGIEDFYDVVSAATVRPDLIELSDTTRAVMIDGKPTLLVEGENDEYGKSCWRAAGKPHVKRY